MIARSGFRTVAGSLTVLAFGFAGVVACSGGSQAVASKYVKTATIGAAGGTITVASADDVTIAGTTITIPANALAADTTITIGVSTQSVAPAGAKAAGPVVDFEPSGTKFLVPVTITLPVVLPSGASSSGLFVEAVEANGDTLDIPASYASGIATFKATGFTDFGACATDGSSSSGCGAAGVSCAAGETCADGVCVTGSETDAGPPNPGGICSTDSDCIDGESCVDGHCSSSSVVVDAGRDVSVGGCTTDADCGPGGTCNGGVCATSGTCTTDSDCAAGETCDSGECTSAVGGCTTDSECAAGQVCVSGECVSNGGGSDAGVDATVCPAGLTDCSGVCSDLSSDSDNCGECGARCATGQTCGNGVCG